MCIRDSTGDDLFAGGDHLFYAGHVVADLFCVLGTVYEAAAAQDAFIRDDIRPVSYTHLDVYKRQALTRIPPAFTMRS